MNVGPIIKNLFVIPLILFVILTVFSSQVIVEQFTALATSIIIHGGSSGSVSCGDGSLAKSNIAFIILSANGTVEGNWTLDNLNDPTNPGTVFTVGEIFSGNVSLSHYKVNGETRNINEVIKLCNPPLFSPIILIGKCGENVPLSVQFQSNNPLNIGNNFNGDVVCEMLDEEARANITDLG